MVKVEGNLVIGIQGSGFYKPYFAWDGKEHREVKNIHFFNTEGVLFSVNSSWLSDEKGHEVKSFSVYCEHYISNKLKPNFSFKVPFLLKVKAPSYNYAKKKFAEVYIPYNLVEFKFVKHAHQFDTPTDKVYSDYWVTGNVWIRVNTTYEPIIDNVNFINNVTPLAKLLGVEHISEYTLLANKDQILKTINELSRVL